MLLDSISIKSGTTLLDHLPGPAFGLFLSELTQQNTNSQAAQQNSPKVVICQNAQQAQRLSDEILFFSPELENKLFIFPDWETLAYDNFSPHEDISSKRIELLAKLPLFTSNSILIITASNLMQKVAPKDFIGLNSFVLKTGDNLNLTETQKNLQHMGYHHVSEVFSHGEFAVRGSVFDIYPSGSQLPYRIDLFDDEVDSIRIFNPEDQLSTEKVEQINLLPAREYPFNKESIAHFKHQWKVRFDSDPKQCPSYQTVSKNTIFSGIEYYAPLFFNTEMANILDYFPDSTQIICAGNINNAIEYYWQEIKSRYEQRRHDVSHPILSPESLWQRPEELFSQINEFQQVKISENNKLNLFEFGEITNIEVNYRLDPVLKNLISFQENNQSKILICAESLGRKEIIKELFQKSRVKLAELNSWGEYLALNSQHNNHDDFYITVGNIWSSIFIKSNNLVLLAESDLFGQKVTQRRRRKASQEHSQETQERVLVKSIAELGIGDPVVHLEHGVGRYLGLQNINLGAQNSEFLAIEYAKGDKLYVPVTSLHLISRYSAGETQHAPIHNLSSDLWEKSKKKALSKAYDVAAELLGIYAQREAFEGESFECDTQNYKAFADGFAFEETPDQEMAIKAVIKDLGAKQPMDRVICGDVGFGKTEVAMRAAFITAMNHRQTAILVPTTLLAEQHGENFIDRFADWPVNIAVLSRFKTPKQQKEIIENLSNGQIDIVIGTHKLLQQDINFSQLGLLVIDEEHRFGVRQKEKMKKLKAKVNLLTMTATPIPRTLNMAMSKLREFSIIASPPAKRLSIKTFVSERRKNHIIEAVEREHHRGGQVFFLHNNVKTIQHCAEELNTWMPNAQIQVAHGQMPERELEKIMADFYHQKFNILVCTTIIETGIDVPTANTIIMDRADKLGLAQLHQLRGRVGRSHHQAYAHLLHPGKDAMTKDAVKRLEAIESLGDLGAGFNLASHDLEIRGAGELLGEEQSGQMQEVGFSLYLELIEKAVRDLKSGKTPNYDFNFAKESEIDLGIQALIPEDYLPDIHNRLGFYKRISDATDIESLDQLQIEMIDRFGLLPDPAKNLFSITEIKLQLAPIGIKKLTANSKFIKVEFLEKNKLDPVKIIKLIQSRPNTFKLMNQSQLKIMMLEHPIDQRVNKVTEKIDKILECVS